MTTKRNWRRTPLNLLDGQVEMLRDDWPLARIYFKVHGPHAGRWGWFVHIAPDFWGSALLAVPFSLPQKLSRWAAFTRVEDKMGQAGQ